jgi:hypothetical protein
MYGLKKYGVSTGMNNDGQRSTGSWPKVGKKSVECQTDIGQLSDISRMKVKRMLDGCKMEVGRNIKTIEWQNGRMIEWMNGRSAE